MYGPNVANIPSRYVGSRALGAGIRDPGFFIKRLSDSEIKSSQHLPDLRCLRAFLHERVYLVPIKDA